jgi:ABC-type lipoprotein release transport system permease subunit
MNNCAARAVTLAAGVVPALHAARIDPIVTLRHRSDESR